MTASKKAGWTARWKENLSNTALDLSDGVLAETTRSNLTTMLLQAAKLGEEIPKDGSV
jgi:hypothetical protein